MNYCINCGESGTLEAQEQPKHTCEPFLERGEWLGNSYSEERPVVILVCQECGHEMIDLS